MKARHDFLKETGGRFAVRKAIERKQKKTSQKEKRQRPSFADRPKPPTVDAGNLRKCKRKRTE